MKEAMTHPLEARSSDCLHVQFDAEASHTLWITMARRDAGGAHKFDMARMSGMHELVRAITNNNGDAGTTPALPVRSAVIKSGHPEYFGLGGDLAYFHECIRWQDREGLYRYSRLALDAIYDLASLSACGTTAIALVQGKALGGGCELALAPDFLIAEEHSVFSLPEIRFGLFPCSGAMSFLASRVGAREAERMMTNNRLYSAGEWKEMGIIDEICRQGEGTHAVREFIAAHAKYREPRLALQRARRRHERLDYTELLTVVLDWVELAMRLGDDKLQVMEMIIKLQEGMMQKSRVDC